jgi:glutamate-1-semialdehyde aminotransferase
VTRSETLFPKALQYLPGGVSRDTVLHDPHPFYASVIPFNNPQVALDRRNRQPDLTALGKAMGGGFPVGAVAGSNEVMAVFAAVERGQRLPQSGTFSANPVTMTAGLVAMQHLGSEAIRGLNRRGEQARTRIGEAIKLGMLSTVMDQTHIDQLAEGVWSSLRRLGGLQCE